MVCVCLLQLKGLCIADLNSNNNNNINSNSNNYFWEYMRTGAKKEKTGCGFGKTEASSAD